MAAILWPTKDAARLNAIANHPAVRPHIGAPELGPLDFSQAVEHPDNFFLLGDHGNVVFHRLSPTRYELHIAVLPEGRGKGVQPMFDAAFQWAFARGCQEIVAQIPANNRPAHLVARRAGFRPTGQHRPSWAKGETVTAYSIHRVAWLARTQPTAEAA